MVQTYGIAPENSAESSLDVDEARALLATPETPNKKDGRVDGHATLISCISNLLNTIIGSGAWNLRQLLFPQCRLTFLQECLHFLW